MENKVIAKSFFWMFVGLLITFITGFTLCQSAGNMTMGLGALVLISIVLQFILVIVLSVRVFKMKPLTAKIIFIVYSLVTGVTFSSIFAYYEMSSIILVFALASAIFLLMSLIGYTTKLDLSKVGSYLLFGLITVIICSIINIFWINDTFTTIICIISILVFLGLTAWDVQKIKRLGEQNNVENVAIYGALELYLDFINIFLDLLKLFGKSKD